MMQKSFKEAIMKKDMEKKNLIKILILGVFLILIGCKANTGEIESGSEMQESESAMIEEPAETTEAEVLAVVDGDAITTKDVESIKQAFMQRGQALSDEDALEQMINEKILLKEIDKKGIPTQDEVESDLQEIFKQQNLTLQDFKEQLEQQGLKYEDQIKVIGMQMAVQNYIQSVFEDENVNVTEKEVEAFYNQSKAQAPEDSEVPEFEEIREQLTMLLQQQKQQQILSALVQELRKNVSVEYK